jgi:hypothetical protein
MHNRADQLGKSILRDALSRASTAETEVEVLAATQRIDVYSIPDPTREAERAQMGLLGELAAEPSLFEPFRNTPTLRQLRRCVNKQHTWHHELERRSRGAAGSAPTEADPDGPDPEVVPFPALVVIGPGRPETVLDAYGCRPATPGVYHAVWGLALRVIVLAELPRTRATVLLRLLGSRRILHEALADLAALPSDAWEKGVATPLLVHFRLGTTEPATNEEDDVSAEIHAWYEDYQNKLRAERAEERKEGRKEGHKEGHKEGRKEGRDEGRKEEARSLLLRLLRARFGELPPAAVARIEGAELGDVERWVDRVLGARSLAEVLGEPS